MANTRRDERAAQKAEQRAALSGAGPTGEGAIARFPGAKARFALFGEVLLVGMLMTALCVPLVTVPIALAAGIRHLRRYLNAEDSRLALFWIDVRRGVAGGAVVGLVTVVLVLILLLDIDLAGTGTLPGGPLIAVVGWLGLAATGVALLTAASAWSPEHGWRGAVRRIPTLVADDVRGALYLVATLVFVAAVTWALPPLLIAGLGCAALAAVAIPVRPSRLAHTH